MEEKDFDMFANWWVRAQQEKRRAQSSGDYARLTKHYSIGDYDIRKQGDHFESYNTITGEVLFEAQTREEAKRDLREVFA